MDFIKEFIDLETMRQMSFISLLISFIVLYFSIARFYEKKSFKKSINDIIQKSKQSINKEKTITMVYFHHRKVKSSKIKTLLVAVFALIFPYSIYIQKLEIIISSAIILLIYFLITVYENIMEYRIINGYFGGNYSEARSLISFMVENSDDIDFDDSDGFSGKKLFFPERKKNSLLPNILGEKT